MTTHVTPAWVPTLPAPIRACQVAMFMEQQLGDQSEGSWTQGTVERTWLWWLWYQGGICDLHHLDLDEVTWGCGGAAIIRCQDLVGGEEQGACGPCLETSPEAPTYLNVCFTAGHCSLSF